MKYAFEITRTLFSSIDKEVEADSPKEAREKIEEMYAAGEFDKELEENAIQSDEGDNIVLWANGFGKKGWVQWYE